MNTEADVSALTAQQRSLLEVLPCYVFVQRGKNVVYANRAAREILHVDENAFLQVDDLFSGQYPGFAYANSGWSSRGSATVLGSATQAYSSDFNCYMRTPLDPTVPVRGSFRMLRVEPEPELLIVVLGSRREREKDLKQDAGSGTPSNFLEHLLNAAPEAIMITRGSKILHINREFESLFGFSADEALGQNTYDLLIPETRRHEFDILEHTMQLHGRASMETVRLHKSGELIDVSILVAPITISGVEVGNFVSYRDIREKKQTDARLQHDALHDPLTGLANRTLFLDRLQLTMARQQRHSELNFAVMFLDLDRFRAVNDNLGHASGDDLLVRMAARLRACFRPEDTVARFEGDEFAILLEDVTNISDVTRIAERAQHDICLPIEVNGHEIFISASIGIAFGTLDHTSPEQILRDADFAMYQAKSNGHARHEVFDGSMHVHVAAQMRKEQDLKKALENKEFEVWYQPIYVLASGEIEGFEALLRWRAADGSFVPAQDFLSTAEETGLIVPLGQFVLEHACRQLTHWAETIPGAKPSIDVNLSLRQFRDPNLLRDLAGLLSKAKFSPQQLRLEISENAVNQDAEGALGVFQGIAALGVSAALDNFGAGLASMNHFIRLPIDLVKVDRRLIAYLPIPGKQAAILQTIFDLGRMLKVRMLAEGIESREQLDALLKMGCDLGQGHLFSAPVSVEKAQLLLEKGSWHI
ncbi:MAG TPA: EAL domain-containing protein [Acidobacteriaceae bacterium]|nr:EAL domain-containing protein [Acidobacteriaceae bacterium]